MVGILIAALLMSANLPAAKIPPGGEAAEGNAARLQVDRPVIPDVDDRMAAQDLTEVHRIYVGALTGGEAAEQFRDMLISSLQRSKLFVMTENEDRADAVLKGGANDAVFEDKFHSTDSLNMHSQMGASTHSSSVRSYDSSSSHNASVSVGENESTNIEERKHEAFAAVRLVNRDGDVIWSSTEESLGGKFLGASADVAEKITRQLAADYRRARAGQNSDWNADRRAPARQAAHVPAGVVMKPVSGR